MGECTQGLWRWSFEMIMLLHGFGRQIYKWVTLLWYSSSAAWWAIF